MSPFFKKTHIRFSPEITAGLCPHCDMQASFISIVNDQYRCMTCGEDVKQEINGVIKYVIADKKTAFKMREFEEDNQKE